MSLLDAFNNAPAGDRTLTSQVPLNTAPTIKSLDLDDKLIHVIGASTVPINLPFVIQNGGFDGLEHIFLLPEQFVDKLFLLKDQADPIENGVYISLTGTTLATRASVALLKGMRFAPAYGDANRGRVFEITTEDPIVVGTTPVTIAVTQSYGIALPIAV